MISVKQQLANQSNAKKGGVKTAQGKEIVKKNALKHGILSRESVISRGDIDEDQKEFALLRNQIFDEIKPIGIVETMLVDRLFTSYWRLRRVVKVERAVIEKQITGYTYKRILDRAKTAGLNKNFASISFYDRIRTSLGCRQLLEETKAVRGAIEEDGLPLPEWAINKLMKELGLSDEFPKANDLWLQHCMAKDREKLGISDEGIKKLSKLALKTTNEFVEFFEMKIELWEKWEQEADEATLETQLIPNNDDFQVIQRYEAHLQRTFDQALHEIQRIQGIRLGKPLPLSAALDVTVNSENGFVS